ncbi:heavy-metal-associated domain-containing protein [Magnetovibrio sp.]|uniref:heavy-metal-associated domain-containing protein n=1 Tax=Magnetovibrio sp. TaxID=2024836 RepID=UPI002F954683
MTDTYKVIGMTCGGCAKSVTNAIMDVAPGAEISVNLDEKTVSVAGADESAVKQAVEEAGFEFSGRA